MEYARLGKTEIEVSRVAMGCWAIAGGHWGEQDERDAVAAIRRALDLGVTTFDTAVAYGDGASEALLGRGLEGRRDEALIATKPKPEAAEMTREGLRASCEASLKRLGTDRIDLYQLHWPNREVPFSETMEGLERLQAEGKIRAIGVCNFGPRDMEEMLACGRFESNQLAYSLITRAIEYEIRPRCREHGIGILAYSPIAQGLLAGKFASPEEVPAFRARTRHFSGEREMARHGEAGCEALTFQAIESVRAVSERLGEPMADVALAWCLHQPGITSVIAGARRPDQIEQNARAAALELPADARRELDEATRPVKEALGPSPDLWQPPGERCR